MCEAEEGNVAVATLTDDNDADENSGKYKVELVWGTTHEVTQRATTQRKRAPRWNVFVSQRNFEIILKQL
jgi:hypothetical protein